MSASIRKHEVSLHDLPFPEWLMECAQRYARADDAPDFYSFDDSINEWQMLHGCGLTPQDALLRMFGTLH